jgi:predicted  nucleic acid-binding Zn-ribbon protein
MAEPKKHKLEEINDEVDNCMGIATDISKRMSKLLLEYNEVKNKYNTIDDNLKKLNTDKKKSDDTIKELEYKLDEATKGHTSDSKENKKTIDDLQEQLGTEKKNNKNLKDEADSAKQNLLEIEQYSDSLKDKIDTLKKELTTIQGNLSQEGGMRHKQHGGNKQMNVTHYRINY